MAGPRSGATGWFRRPSTGRLSTGWAARELRAGPVHAVQLGLYGQGNPQDIDDAAAATVRHLCGTYGDVNGDHLRGAIVSYYGADQDGYADDVLADIATYDRAAPYLVEDREGKERTLSVRAGSFGT